MTIRSDLQISASTTYSTRIESNAFVPCTIGGYHYIGRPGITPHERLRAQRGATRAPNGGARTAPRHARRRCGNPKLEQGRGTITIVTRWSR